MTSPPQHKTEAVADALAHLLGQTLLLAETLLNFRWNVTGVHALGLSGLFKQQADELWQAADALGERMRDLDHPAAPDKSETIIAPCMKPSDGTTICHQMICVVQQGHEEMIVALEAALDVAVDTSDYGSTELLSARIAAHQRHRRVLSSLVTGS